MPDSLPSPGAPEGPRSDPSDHGFEPVVPAFPSPPTPRDPSGAALASGVPAGQAPTPPAPNDPYGVHPPAATPFPYASPRYPGPAGGGWTAAPAAPAAPPVSGAGRALGVAALVLGVLAALGSAVPIVNVASVAFGAAGTGLGVAALFLLARGRGLALAGTITSIVALVVSVALAVLYSGFLAAVTSTGLFGPVGYGFPGFEDEYVEETIAPLDESAPAGTFDAPVPLGETVVVTRDGEPRWEITLTDATYDAVDEVQAANAGADVSRDLVGGLTQYAYVSAEVTYLGEDSAVLYAEVYFSFAATANNYYYPDEVPLVAPGNDLALVEDVQSGEMAEGNILVALPADVEQSGRWTVSGEWTDVLYVAAD